MARFEVTKITATDSIEEKLKAAYTSAAENGGRIIADHIFHKDVYKDGGLETHYLVAQIDGRDAPTK
jgi:hypothetical protein